MLQEKSLAKKIWQAKLYEFFHKVSGETTIFARPKVQARLHFLKKLQEVSDTV